MSEKRKRRQQEMSDVEYYESGQAKQDLYDELMKCRAELAEAVKALDAARDEYETHFGRLADGTTLGHWTRRAREIVEKHHAAG